MNFGIGLILGWFCLARFVIQTWQPRSSCSHFSLFQGLVSLWICHCWWGFVFICTKCVKDGKVWCDCFWWCRLKLCSSRTTSVLSNYCSLSALTLFTRKITGKQMTGQRTESSLEHDGKAQSFLSMWPFLPLKLTD